MKQNNHVIWALTILTICSLALAIVFLLGMMFIHNSNPFTFKIEMDENSKDSFERALDIREKEIDSMSVPDCCFPTDCIQSRMNPSNCTCTYMVECGVGNG